MSFDQRIGVVGGGQLARMLVQKGQEMGLQMHVLCSTLQEPAAQVTGFVHIGKADNADDLRKFFRAVDVVTVESEFHSAELLGAIEKETERPLFPAAPLLGSLQDRLSQKELLKKYKIPTAEFCSVKSFEDLKAASEQFPKGFVLKKRRGGYDGYGTFVVKSPKDLRSAGEAFNFKEEPCIAEAFIPFQRELAVIFSRNPRGQIATLPVVETHQVKNRLDWLQGPCKVPPAKMLIAKLKKFLNSIDFVGTIAFELFDAGRAGLLINEIAPRVHNSGHYSLEALDFDQFTLHLRALMDQDLKEPRLLSPKFSMVNLIGAGEKKPTPAKVLTGHLHWYGKSESRDGRKMGHVTYLGPDRDGGLARALRERKGFRL